MSADKVVYPEKDRPPGKRLKIRSTCNACQQAKIRCSHDKPSCHRCLKQNIPCVYSVSRRLGRPSRQQKELNKAGGNNGGESAENPNEGRREGSQEWVHEETEDSTSNPALVDTTEEIPVESDSRETPLISYTNGDQSYPDDTGLDFNTESWMHGLDCNSISENPNERDMLDDSGMIIECDNILPELASYSRLGRAASRSQDQFRNAMRSTGSFHSHKEELETGKETAIDQQNTYLLSAGNDMQYSQYTDGRPNSMSPNDPDSFFTTGFQFVRDSLQPQHIRQTSKLAESICDFTSEDSGLGSTLSSGTDRCHCYEAVLRELLHIDRSCSRDIALSIDASLRCQQRFQDLVRMVLQCGTCSTMRSNLLMLLIVSMDTLISMLEAALSSRSSPQKDPFGGGDLETQCLSSLGRRYSDANFLAQVEACPLLIGSYRVRLDEKTSFLKHILHARLCALSSTIRILRLHIQQNPQISSSKARLMMVMEIDRRLQLIIMKVKLWKG